MHVMLHFTASRIYHVLGRFQKFVSMHSSSLVRAPPSSLSCRTPTRPVTLHLTHHGTTHTCLCLCLLQNTDIDCICWTSPHPYHRNLLHHHQSARLRSRSAQQRCVQHQTRSPPMAMESAMAQTERMATLKASSMRSTIASRQHANTPQSI